MLIMTRMMMMMMMMMMMTTTTTTMINPLHEKKLRGVESRHLYTAQKHKML